MDFGKFDFSNMINFLNHNTSSSEESDSDTPSLCEEDSDSDESSTCSKDSDTSSEDQRVDSIFKVSKKYHSCYEITLDDVREIEKTLDLYEFISVIFLLFDKSEMYEFVLQDIRSMIAAGLENFSRDKLTKSALISSKNWNYKLLEALAIIQNHSILMKFGFCKEDISAMRNAPQHVNRLKKVLFSCIFDYFTRGQAQQLINAVREDAKFKDDITLNCDPLYIEFHFLFWISQNYISLEKEPYLHNLIKHLKCIDYQMYEKLNEEVDAWIRSRPTYPKDNQNDDQDEYYKIRDPKNPGLLVIINNMNFKKNVEWRKEFQSKISKDSLDDRIGSDKDGRKLNKTFKGLNYKVVEIKDVFHDKMVDKICDTVRDNFEVGHHSVLVLCVLSHGAKGEVFGVNSVPVKIKEIINSVSHLNDLLAGIPKVFIIQACQGSKVLFAEPEENLLVPDGTMAGSSTVSEGNDLSLDGPENCDPEAENDRVVCMATIKGYVALRSLKNGTKYIQELCQCIEKYHTKKHFVDIITKVQQSLTSEKCIVNQVHKRRPVCMIPEIKSFTLRKLLYLSPKQVTAS